MWEEKEITCLALGLEGFAQHVRRRQGVSEEFWSILASVVGGSVHNIRYLNAEKANDAESSDVAQAGTPRANQKTVARKGHGKSPRPCKSTD